MTNPSEEEAMNPVQPIAPAIPETGPRMRTDPQAKQWIEEGTAFTHLTGATAPATNGGDSPKPAPTERIPVIVIGAGQAGLSVGYHLARLGVRFLILERSARVGDVWRNRWDSLRLFTPAKLDGLDGMRFPAHGDTFPTTDALADYLESYAKRFSLPVRTGVRVDSVTKEGDRFLVTAGAERFEADQVVVAMSSYQDPFTPGFARELRPDIVQLHSSAYRNPGQMKPGDVLLVGAGNSGSEIALELGRNGHGVWMVGRDTGHLPFRIEGQLSLRVVVRLLLRGIFHRVLTVDTPMGRKARPHFVLKGGPLIRVKPWDLAKVGVRRAGRVTGVKNGLPVLDDGRVLEVRNIIWCTGFRNDVSWIHLPVFDEQGIPKQYRGRSIEPGLYFVGLAFLYSVSSTMVHGVGRDARRVAEQIHARVKQSAAA